MVVNWDGKWCLCALSVYLKWVSLTHTLLFYTCSNIFINYFCFNYSKQHDKQTFRGNSNIRYGEHILSKNCSTFCIWTEIYS